MKKTLELFIDGASSGNPGDATIGVVIIEGDQTIKKISQYIGKATNNVAEYTALIYGLQEALMLKAEKIQINTDSEILYRQIKGEYKIRNPNLKFLFLLIHHLCGGFEGVNIRHIPREKNKEADTLASKALKKEQVKMAAQMFNIGEESPSSEG